MIVANGSVVTFGHGAAGGAWQDGPALPKATATGMVDAHRGLRYLSTG
jgi:hypothetical protein